MRLSEAVLSLGRLLLSGGGEQNEEDFLSLLNQNTSAVGLDCGCSNGTLTCRIQARTAASMIIGVELSSEASVATANNVAVCKADLNTGIPFRDESFHFVVASYIIEHLYQSDMFIQEAHRVLKKRGYALFATDNLASLKIIIPLVLGLHPITCSFSDRFYTPNPFTPEKLTRRKTPDRSHLRIFTPRILKALLEANGFGVEQTKPVGYFPFTPKMAKLMNLIDGNHSSWFYTKARKP